MGWAGQIISQLFSVIPSNRRTFNLLDGISSPLFAFRALGQRGFRELVLSKWSLQRLRQKWKVPWAVEMCCLLGLVQVCVDTQHIRAQLKCPFWFGEVLGQKKKKRKTTTKEGAVPCEKQANSVQWGMAPWWHEARWCECDTARYRTNTNWD